MISDNTAYNQDQNTIVRIGHNLALTEKNDATMYYNSILQAGGFSATIGSLSTKGGDGQFLGNAGTQSASANASTEIIENAASTVGTIRINQATPATAEVAWDAMFRDGIAGQPLGGARPVRRRSELEPCQGWRRLGDADPGQ